MSEVRESMSKHELYVEGLMQGKSRRQAALDAGFSKCQSANPMRRIEALMSHELVRKALTKRPIALACKSRRELYVEGLMDGKTKRQAGLDAGFTVNQAHNAKDRIEGPITQALIARSLMDAGVTLTRLAQKMDEGLEATKVQTVPGGQGKPATLKLVADFETRLKYHQHACKLMGVRAEEEREVPEMRVNVVALTGDELREARGEIVRPKVAEIASSSVGR